jgi:hypothetical protein
MYWDRQHGHEHAACTWTSSMDMNMQHRHGHAAWTWTCSMSMCPCCTFMSMVNVYDDVACPSPCCMSMSMLHVHVHAVCPCPYFTSMSMLHVHVNVACSSPCSMELDLQDRLEDAALTWKSCIDLNMLYLHGHAAWHGLGNATQTWTCSMDMFALL